VIEKGLRVGTDTRRLHVVTRSREEVSLELCELGMMLGGPTSQSRSSLRRKSQASETFANGSTYEKET
jgi:hypothetical protein